MRCPACGIEFEYDFEFTQGTHIDYYCSCGQFLQWDHSVTSPRAYAYIIGLPQPCEHADLKKFNASLPLL